MFSCPLIEAAREAPDRIAWEFPEGSWTFRELDKRVSERVSELCLAGVLPGTVINIRPVAELEWLVSWLALVRLGAVAVMGDMRVPTFLGEEVGISIIQTSGTTGQPKLAMHGLAQYLNSARVVNAALGVMETSRVWLNLPVTHVGGLAWVWRGLLARATIVCSATLPVGVTHLSWVPTQLSRALERPELWPELWPELRPELRQLKVIFLGGAPVAESVLRRAWDLDLPVWPVYGMTEMTSSIALRKVGEPGLTVLPEREVKLSASGEILVKGNSLFMGYVTETGLDCPVDNEGYFATRDCGAFEAGRLRVLGRLDELIISGGENIWPGEIETALLQVPGVLTAKVVKVADVEFGERPGAFVTMVDGSVPDSEGIRQQLRAFLPGFKLPVWIH